MHTGLLKSGFIFFLSFLLSVSVQAQQTYFIYIQTENKQPFYIKMDNRVFSSSSSGYIIISGLTDSAYKLVIGFPNNEWPELNVTVDVKDTDVGLLLKNYNEGGWGMINLQSAEFQVMQKSSALIEEMKEKITENEFARVLAAVVNDPSIAEVTIAKKITETIIKTPENKTMAIPVNDSSIAEVSVAKKIIEPATKVTENKTIDIPVNDSSIAEVSVAKKITEPATKVTENKTIDIPVNKKVIPNSVSKKDIVDTMGTRFINMELQNPNAKTDSGSVKKDDFVIKEKKQTKQTELDADKEVNLNCKKTATQSDFLRLRKQMAGQASEQNMIKAAYKQFATACYTTEQIKNLGVLFIVEEEKYKFYLAAFPYVTDRDNYGILKDQFTDNYYKTRFSAMMGN